MRRSLAIAVLVSIAVTAVGQDSVRRSTVFSVTGYPHVTFPVANDPAYFTTGGGAEVAVDIPLPFLPRIALRIGAGYELLPVWSGDSTNFAQIAGGVSVAGPTIGERFTTELHTGGGYYYGVVSGDASASGGNALFGGGIRLGWRPNSRFDQGLDARFITTLDGTGGILYSGVSIGLSTRYGFLRRSELEFRDIQFENVFPVLYKRYTDTPFGTVTIVNDSPSDIEELEISFFVNGYMDSPWLCIAPQNVAGGETAEVRIVALFNERDVLAITEATVVTGQLRASYTLDGDRQTVDQSASIRILDRHAMTWDDDRKAAAYVTHKDPLVVDLASNIARVAESRGNVMDRNFRTAVALHESLRIYGLQYRIDPTTPFIEFSESTDAIDYIQFPRNTLQRRAGDCDDLSILYAAMLQSVGIDTAFITIPGHIFAAFALSASPREARSLFASTEDFIIHNDRAWVPFEITLVDSPFTQAWTTGAAQWRANSESGTAMIHPVAEAWQEYEPVAQVGEFDASGFVSMEESIAGFVLEFDRVVDRQISTQAGPLLRKVSDGSAAVRDLNRLGSIYARYGRLEEARTHFQAAWADDYYPALVNLANLEYLEGALERSLELYRLAMDARPGDPILLLQMARVQSDLGDLESASSAYDELLDVEPELAQEHAYLNLSLPTAQRAASRQVSGASMIWVDE